MDFLGNVQKECSVGMFKRSPTVTITGEFDWRISRKISGSGDRIWKKIPEETTGDSSFEMHRDFLEQIIE